MLKSPRARSVFEISFGFLRVWGLKNENPDITTDHKDIRCLETMQTLVLITFHTYQCLLAVSHTNIHKDQIHGLHTPMTF